MTMIILFLYPENLENQATSIPYIHNEHNFVLITYSLESAKNVQETLWGKEDDIEK
jgi:hypothetical protein